MEPIRIDFPSLGAMADRANSAPKDGASWQTDGSHGINSWTFGVSRPRAVEMAKHGWPEGAAATKRLLDDLNLPPIEEPYSQTFHGVTGAYVDVGEYVQGMPECMIDFQEDKRAARFVHIIVAGGYAAAFSADEIMQRGVTIAACIDALEARGVRCSVEMRYQSPEWHTISVDLKHASDPLNLDVLAFALAHPACYRRLGFGVCDAQPDAIRDAAGFREGLGYGSSQPFTDIDPSALLFNTMKYGTHWTRAYSLKKVREALAKYTLATTSVEET